MTAAYTDRIQGVSTSIAVKAPVLVATTVNIALSGLQTIDGVTVAAGDRVFVKDQTDGTENGIYKVATGSWARATDFNDSRDIAKGTRFSVVSGTVGTGLYELTTSSPVLGTSSLSFDFVGRGVYYQGQWDASTGVFPGGGNANLNDLYNVVAGGTVDGEVFVGGDNIIATANNASTSTFAGNWDHWQVSGSVFDVAGLTGSIAKSTLLTALNVADGADVTDPKLATIEENADVTDTANVTAAGAFMDSEAANLAALKAIDQALDTLASPAWVATTVSSAAGTAKMSVTETGATTSSVVLDITSNARPIVQIDNTSVGAGEGLWKISVANNGDFEINNNVSGGVDFDLDKNGNLSIGGTVDGRDIATDGTKLDLFTITSAADIDQMVIDIAAAGTGIVPKGNWDASSGSFPGGGSAQTGWRYYVDTAGTVDSVSFVIGDILVALADNASTSTFAGNWSQEASPVAVTSVAGLTGAPTDAALRTAINVEDGATADQTAGEILTAIKTVDGAGSGLDAELLDGQAASYYATADSAALTGQPHLTRATNAEYRIQATNNPIGYFAINSNSGILSFKNQARSGMGTGGDVIRYTEATPELRIMGTAYLNGSGDLGLGVSSPTEKLDVSGNAKISGTLTLAGVVVPVASFHTRADFVTASASMSATDGDIVFAGGYAYIAASGSTEISDLNDWEPAMEVYPNHFGDFAEGDDISAELELALEYTFAQRNRTCRLPSGTYDLASLVDATYPVAGSGAPMHRSWFDGTGCTLVVPTANTTGAIKITKVNNSQHLIVQNLTIHSEIVIATHGASTNGRALEVHSTLQPGDAGWGVTGEPEVIVRNCVIACTNNATTGRWDEGIHIDGCWFPRVEKCWVLTNHPGTTSDTNHETGHALFFDNCYSPFAENNYFIGRWLNCVRITDTDNDGNSEDFKLLGNYYVGGKVGIYIDPDNAQTDKEPGGHIIGGHMNNPQHNIYIKYKRQITIGDLMCYTIGGSGLQNYADAACVYLEDCAAITVSGINNPEYGHYTSTADCHSGVRLEGDTDHCNIVGCQFGANGIGIFQGSSGTANIESGNGFTGVTTAWTTGPTTQVYIDSGGINGSNSHRTTTPTLQFGGAATGMTFGTQTAGYIKTGRNVDWWVNIVLTAKGSSTGVAKIDGSFPAKLTGSVGGATVAYTANMPDGIDGGFVEDNGTITLYKRSATDTMSTAIRETDFNNTSTVRLTGRYIAAA